MRVRWLGWAGVEMADGATLGIDPVRDAAERFAVAAAEHGVPVRRPAAGESATPEPRGHEEHLAS